jgi:hypothetical protein
MIASLSIVVPVNQAQRYIIRCIAAYVARRRAILRTTNQIATATARISAATAPSAI